MSSPRNMAILGLSTFIGLLVPTWVEKVGTPIDTGNGNFDRLVQLLLGNPNLVGTLLACFMDNTVPGTREERGIAAWQQSDEDDGKIDRSFYNEGYEVYMPLLPKSFLNMAILKYIPFLPYTKRESSQANNTMDVEMKAE